MTINQANGVTVMNSSTENNNLPTDANYIQLCSSHECDFELSIFTSFKLQDKTSKFINLVTHTFTSSIRSEFVTDQSH